jgi:hypothetical protein
MNYLRINWNSAWIKLMSDQIFYLHVIIWLIFDHTFWLGKSIRTTLIKKWNEILNQHLNRHHTLFVILQSDHRNTNF